MALGEIRLQGGSAGLQIPYTIEEEQVGFVGRAIHGIQLDAYHFLAKRVAEPAAVDGLQLLEVSSYHREGQVWLLLHGGRCQIASSY